MSVPVVLLPRPLTPARAHPHSRSSSVEAGDVDLGEDLSFIWSLFDTQASDVDLDSFLDTLVE